MSADRELDRCRATFRKWLGEDYDIGSLGVVLAVAATDQLDGDPVWLLIISGSGNAKTETVIALAGAGGHITSTITSEGALLSATPGKEKAKKATGGLLRKIGDRGLLVIKDFTSIISMNRDARASVLAALREVYDGRWERNVGTDGGMTHTWEGRITLIGATTTAYDAAHGVIATMGDRFAVVRVDSNLGREGAGYQALRNVGQEVTMRCELAAAVGSLLLSVNPDLAVTTDADLGLLFGLADLVTLTRTACERDFKGEPLSAHMPEMPTRFAKMLLQVERGALALGASRAEATTAAVRVAGDSMPPGRLEILADLLVNTEATPWEMAQRLRPSRTTIDRTLQELRLIGLVEYTARKEVLPGGQTVERWHYRLAERVDETDLRTLVTQTTPETVPALEGYGTGEAAQDPSTSYVPMYPVNVSGTVSSPNPDIPTRNGHMAPAAGGPPLALAAASALGADGSGTDPAWLRPLRGQYGSDQS